ncbi:cell envelope-related transcriptional attenuator domain protein [Mycobacterium avium subsp. avium 2285 (R)]|nr:cell envelope-related transcriptional attenuator domain protein [Mycobacterium avium subsp. avium 2285 (R)]
MFEPPPDDRLHRWRPDAAALEPVAAPEDDDEPGGCHTGGGVTVADLIAKVGAPNRPVHRRAAPEETEPFEPEPVEPEPVGSEPPGPASGLPLELQQTQVIDDLAYSVDAVSELRELMATDYPNDGDSDQQSADAAGNPAPAPSDADGRAVGGGPGRCARPGDDRRGVAVERVEKRPAQHDQRARPQFQRHPGPGGQYGDEDFLIVGLDSRAGDNANMGAGSTDDADGARSDTVMLVNIPANRKRVVAVSFPRDLAITPMQCEAWDPSTGKYGPIYDPKTKSWGPKMVYTETKLNSAFAFGGPSVW